MPSLLFDLNTERLVHTLEMLTNEHVATFCDLSRQENTMGMFSPHSFTPTPIAQSFIFRAQQLN